MVRRLLALAAAAAAVALQAAAGAPAVADPVPGTISLAAARGEISSGKETTLSGGLAGAGGLGVELQADPFPYRGFYDASHVTAAPDGTFAFAGLRPDRNTRYRVRVGTELSAPVVVYVDAPAVLRVYDRGPGRAMLTMVSFHSAYFQWAGVPVDWYVARTSRGPFELAAQTGTRDLRPGVTYATATVNPPARRFVFRVCFNAPNESGSGPPAAHRPCRR